ncbi:HAD family hydrolase [Pseudodesulfovibrio tunisiensis]|uniref:HAD family hydrolase n=1 Tax=Pseudodesulfovibrio tunisiensis TaxID=463192 RepID=UPI001FB1D583|nr:hypothetical protein [Pseudodesulfovibrio tunisiensis]
MILVTARTNTKGVLTQIEQLGINEYFSEILITKPGLTAAENKLTALQAFPVKGIIGDTEVDFQAAKGMSLPFFALDRGFRSKSFWEKHSIYRTYSNLLDILPIIGDKV